MDNFKYLGKIYPKNQNCIYEEIKNKFLSWNAYNILFRGFRLPACYLKM